MSRLSWRPRSQRPRLEYRSDRPRHSSRRPRDTAPQRARWLWYGVSAGVALGTLVEDPRASVVGAVLGGLVGAAIDEMLGRHAS